MNLRGPMQTQQNADGTPHFTYYDQALLLSFVWDGKNKHIHVCHGGYGEPVVDAIRIGTGRQWRRPASHLKEFQKACDRYVTTWLTRKAKQGRDQRHES